MPSHKEIKKHWDDLAIKETVSYRASWGDFYMVQKEIDTAKKYISPGDSVCDFGCNNGYCDFQLLDAVKDITIVGVDYASEAIKQAIAYAKDTTTLHRTSFLVGDILDLSTFPKEKFDRVMVKRTVINLNNDDDQIRALNNLETLLNDHGTIILMEALEENLARLNKLRVELDLEALSNPWHNKYLSDRVVYYIRNHFDVRVDENYSSTYYLLSRVFGPIVKKMGNKIKNDYVEEINRLAYLLPNFGDYGVQHLFVLAKKA